jgi:hypothetical protein
VIERLFEPKWMACFAGGLVLRGATTIPDIHRLSMALPIDKIQRMMYTLFKVARISEEKLVADFDKIHSGPGPYQKPAKQLLDGATPDLVAESTSRAIVSTLGYFGDESLSLLLEISEYLERLSTGPLFKNTVDWAECSVALDRIIQQAPCTNKRGFSTVRRVAKRQLQEMEAGIYILDDRSRTLLNNYITEAVKDGLEDPLKRVLSQSQGADTEEHLRTLAEVRRLLRPKIESIVEQLLRNKSVASLRKPPRGRGNKSALADISSDPTVYTDDLESISL